MATTTGFAGSVNSFDGVLVVLVVAVVVFIGVDTLSESFSPFDIGGDDDDDVDDNDGDVVTTGLPVAVVPLPTTVPDEFAFGLLVASPPPPPPRFLSFSSSTP